MHIAVYCSSSDRVAAHYLEAAAALGADLARRGHALVYGGTHHGSMHRLAQAALDGGAEVIGVVPTSMRGLPLQAGLTQLWWAQSMQERKATIARLAGAHIALPGGLGTLEELAEVASHTHLGHVAAPLILCNVDGFYDALFTFLRRAEADHFLGRPLAEAVRIAASPAEALDLAEACAVA